MHKPHLITDQVKRIQTAMARNQITNRLHHLRFTLMAESSPAITKDRAINQIHIQDSPTVLLTNTILATMRQHRATLLKRQYTAQIHQTRTVALLIKAMTQVKLIQMAMARNQITNRLHLRLIRMAE
jgi:hypothetical protein